jgi:uncharacterized OsmC-like protein
MATVRSKYLGDLRTESEHLGSSSKILSDAPLDNKGKGEAFSPTDLLATSLGTCILTTMAIVGEVHGIDIVGTDSEITKIMDSHPRRVKEVVIEIYFPKNYTPKEKQILEKAAFTCPVALSLHADLLKTLHFHYKE